MRMGRWTAVAALVGALAVGGCTDSQTGGDTSREDTGGDGVPSGAVPAPEGTAANPAAAGVPIDSAADSASVTVPPGSVTPETGR